MSEPASVVLRSLAARPEASVPLGEVVAAAGSRVHGLAILLLALPEVVPLPLPSASTVLGLPLLLVSAHLALFGEEGPLPAWMMSRAVPRSILTALARYGSPGLEWLERISRPRWLWLARQERAVGLVCTLMSLILFLPLPLINAPPAAALALLALGMIQRDGISVLLGFAGAAFTLAAIVGLVELGGSLFAR
jgi:hypothetical protein